MSNEHEGQFQCVCGSMYAHVYVCVFILSYIELSEYGSTAQAFLQRDHGVPQSMLV